jgi:translation initiation factor IF-1
MVKNTSGGKNTKKQKRNINKFEKRTKVDYGELFGKIISNNGFSFTVICTDGMRRRGRLCGAMKKGPRLIADSFVVVSLREFEQDKMNCDIIDYADPPINIIDLFNKGCNIKEDIKYINEEEDQFNEFQDTRMTPSTPECDDFDLSDL